MRSGRHGYLLPETRFSTGRADEWTQDGAGRNPLAALSMRNLRQDSKTHYQGFGSTLSVSSRMAKDSFRPY